LAAADPARYPANLRLHDAIFRDVIFRDVISRDVISCDATSRDAISYDVISGDAIPSPFSRDVIPPRIPRGSTADSPRSRIALGALELEPAYYTYYKHFILFYEFVASDKRANKSVSTRNYELFRTSNLRECTSCARYFNIAGRISET